MCNNKKNNNTTNTLTREELENYRFLDYRLTQIEQNLQAGQKRLEQETQRQNQQIITILNTLQEQSLTNQENITLLKTKVHNLEKDHTCLEKLKEAAHTNSTKLQEHHRRLDIYKQILLTIGTTAATSLILALIQITT